MVSNTSPNLPILVRAKFYDISLIQETRRAPRIFSREEEGGRELTLRQNILSTKSVFPKILDWKRGVAQQFPPLDAPPRLTWDGRAKAKMTYTLRSFSTVPSACNCCWRKPSKNVQPHIQTKFNSVYKIRTRWHRFFLTPTRTSNHKDRPKRTLQTWHSCVRASLV